MTEKIIVKRVWDNAEIRVGFDANEVYIETNISNFKERLKKVLLEELPVDKLRYSIKALTIEGYIESAFIKAWNKVVSEFKEETNKVI